MARKLQALGYLARKKLARPRLTSLEASRLEALGIDALRIMERVAVPVLCLVVRMQQLAVLDLWLGVLFLWLAG